MTETITDRPVDTLGTRTAVTRWLADFEKALTARDIDAAATLFVEDCYWRDLVAFTWNIVTVEGIEGVRDLLGQTLDRTLPSGFAVAEELGEAAADTESWIKFDTSVGRGLGHLRLRDGKAWTLLTTLNELKGHEEPKRDRRPKGVEHGAVPNRQTWLEQRRREAEELGHATQPYVVVVGGGQGGIALGARLRQLGVPTIIVDRNPRAGDSWRKRYKSLTLHDPVWYDHLPYIDFPPNWPVFSPKDKIADWLEMYARVMELDYWTSTECLTARPVNGGWEVDVLRSGSPMTLRPSHLVLATGMSGFAFCPPVKGGRERFVRAGGLVFHSSEFPSGSAYKGMKCIVVGSSTSAHDICADLWESGAAEVTMIQRAPSIVVRSETLMELAWGRLYSEAALANGITTDIADLTLASVPFKELPGLQRPLYAEIARRDADLYEGLTRAGFLHDMGEDGSGLHS